MDDIKPIGVAILASLAVTTMSSAAPPITAIRNNEHSPVDLRRAEIVTSIITIGIASLMNMEYVIIMTGVLVLYFGMYEAAIRGM